MTAVLVRGLRWTGRETRWWLVGTARLVGRHLRLALVLGLLAFVLVAVDRLTPLLVAGGVVLSLALWSRTGPKSYGRLIAGPWWRSLTHRRVRRSWPTLMDSCGLGRRNPSAKDGQPRVVVPALRSLRWRDGQLIATPGLLVGQTVDDIESAADRLRVAVGATRCRITANPAFTGCQVAWMFGDPLAAPFPATLPPRDTVDLEAVTLGRTEDGTVWRLPLRVSTLCAGSSGSGKASLLWRLVLALGPAIRTGLVEVHGVDLKGGMELAMGRALFTRYATSPEEAVVLLEDTATDLRARAQRIAGQVRTHTPTICDPLVLVVVDELAALVAYVTDRDLLRRAEAALSVVLSQGRAPGFYVYGFVQDPRKETVKMRHLFTQSVALRLRDREEVAMVLGDGALQAGAWCHKIPHTTPGVGYAVGEDGRPVRVRAGHITDQLIREAAQLFPAPRQTPILVPVPEASARTSTRRPRATASTSGSEAA